MQGSSAISQKSPWLVLVVCSVGTFMATLDASIVNVAMPTITSGFGVDLSLAQWIVSAYLLVISSLLPVFGRAGDMYGPRRVYTTGFLLFAVSSAVCGLAHTIYALIAARVFQAVGASMLMANGPGIVARAFPPELRGRALGTMGSVVALGSMTGPSLGGLLVGILGWEAIFLVNIPIGIAGFLLGRTILSPGDRRHEESFDIAGAILFPLGMSSLLIVLSHGGEWGWGSTVTVCGMVVALLSFALFRWVEGRVEHPMLDLALFRIWPFLAGNLSGLFSFMALFSNAILMPFYLSTIMQLTPAQIGLLITPFPLVMAVAAPTSGYLSEKISPVILTTGGLIITAASLFFLSTLGVGASIWQIIGAQAALGLGNGLFQAPNNNSVMSSVARQKMGVAGSVCALVRNLGMVTGTAVAVSVFENQRRYAMSNLAQPGMEQSVAAFLSGYHMALLIGASFAVLAAVISLNRRGHVGVGAKS